MTRALNRSRSTRSCEPSLAFQSQIPTRLGLGRERSFEVQYRATVRTAYLRGGPQHSAEEPVDSRLRGSSRYEESNPFPRPCVQTSG